MGIMVSDITFRNAWYWLQGNLRYLLYYRDRFRWLIPRHIREQIAFRISVMDSECYSGGSCKLCGCRTTALQMSNKSCDKPCYPPMMGVRDWDRFRLGLAVEFDGWSWALFVNAGMYELRRFNGSDLFVVSRIEIGRVCLSES